MITITNEAIDKAPIKKSYKRLFKNSIESIKETLEINHGNNEPVQFPQLLINYIYKLEKFDQDLKERIEFLLETNTLEKLMVDLGLEYKIKEIKNIKKKLDDPKIRRDGFDINTSAFQQQIIAKIEAKYDRDEKTRNKLINKVKNRRYDAIPVNMDDHITKLENELTKFRKRPWYKGIIDILDFAHPRIYVVPEIYESKIDAIESEQAIESIQEIHENNTTIQKLGILYDNDYKEKEEQPNRTTTASELLYWLLKMIYNFIPNIKMYVFNIQYKPSNGEISNIGEFKFRTNHQTWVTIAKILDNILYIPENQIVEIKLRLFQVIYDMLTFRRYHNGALYNECIHTIKLLYTVEEFYIFKQKIDSILTNDTSVEDHSNKFKLLLDDITSVDEVNFDNYGEFDDNFKNEVKKLFDEFKRATQDYAEYLTSLETLNVKILPAELEKLKSECENTNIDDFKQTHRLNKKIPNYILNPEKTSKHYRTRDNINIGIKYHLLLISSKLDQLTQLIKDKQNDNTPEENPQVNELKTKITEYHYLNNFSNSDTFESVYKLLIDSRNQINHE